MASLKTEIYVSADGLEFTKLDLHKDEKIVLKYTQKDLQDISKIFAPYSANFTFPATVNNKKAFEFFGDTNVVKINIQRKFFCKIYSQGQLYQNGYLILSNLSYKMGKAQDFTGSFANNITNLRDRIGEDTIDNLGSYTLVWNPSKCYSLLQGKESFTIDGINYLYYVPLVSQNRVWSYNETDEFENLDNIAFRDGTNPNSNNLVKVSELRPALAFRTIFDLIKDKYELDIVIPLENEDRYKKLFVWCNAESFLNSSFKKLILKNNLGAWKTRGVNIPNYISEPYKYTIEENLTDSSYKITKGSVGVYSNFYRNYCVLNFEFINMLLTSEITSVSTVDVSLVRKSDGVSFLTSSSEIKNGNINFGIVIYDDNFLTDEIEFYVFMKFNTPVNWSINNIDFNFHGPYKPNNLINTETFSRVIYKISINNNNSVESGAGTIDLIKTLPPTKVIDFLNSFIKVFNISIYDTSPDNNKLYWLTPKDIETQGLTYSKATFDYTPYVDIEGYNKLVPNEYNYYNFKHATSKYRSNIDYKSQTGIEYGQTLYPTIKPSKANEFKVETSFSIIPPRIVIGSNGIITAYGFNADTPTILDSGESRYKPNYNELTLFYCNNNNTEIEPIGFQFQPVGGAFNYVILNQWFISTPFLINNFSLAFSQLKEQNVEYPINLFSEYYQANIARYLDPNVLSQEFKLTLPASELYLNEYTFVQDGGVTPIGFRLQNDIIIIEDKFTILDAQIDITTGETTMTLLNY
jgi:hypothetical protein